jgi:hypothetical protein
MNTCSFAGETLLAFDVLDIMTYYNAVSGEDMVFDRVKRRVLGASVGVVEY